MIFIVHAPKLADFATAPVKTGKLSIAITGTSKDAYKITDLSIGLEIIASISTTTSIEWAATPSVSSGKAALPVKVTNKATLYYIISMDN